MEGQNEPAVFMSPKGLRRFSHLHAQSNHCFSRPHFHLRPFIKENSLFDLHEWPLPSL